MPCLERAIRRGSKGQGGGWGRRPVGGGGRVCCEYTSCLCNNLVSAEGPVRTIIVESAFYSGRALETILL